MNDEKNKALQTHNPDVLSCLANLSNDEVFTPPDVVNAMLDLLPQELFTNPETRFLDPTTKTGGFLREIAKRLLVGLEPIIPDLQKRIDHIYRKQLFGIAITELTSLVSRRTLYCSKYASLKYSVCHFENPEGNIRYREIPHSWVNGRCAFCGASEVAYGAQARGRRETHAYEFIHRQDPNDIFNMKFDVIIGNPPYQLEDGGASASATPIYNLFVDAAKKLQPRYLCMVIPARWFSGGKGLDHFRQDMLTDNHLQSICDYFDSTLCFPGVDISGGVCYFLWSRDYKGQCCVRSIMKDGTSEMIRPLLEQGSDVYLRFNKAVDIYRKVQSLSEGNNFDSIVSSRKPFGLTTNIQGEAKSKNRTIKCYSNRNVAKEPGYLSLNDIIQHQEWINSYKVLISRAYGERGSFPYLALGKPFIGEPGSCCSETYLVIGPFEDQQTAENVMSYIRTRFFRFMVLLQKNTQDAPKRVYTFVPMQDFSKAWTDEELYAKYGLNEEEIAFIESMIRPMEA